MASLSNYISILDPSLLVVMAGTVLLSISASLVGTFAFLQKRSLVGDAVAHAILPGIALAFILKGEKDPLILLFGALISGWIAIALMDFISTKTKLSSDTAIATILSVFFGFGILLLTYIQGQANGNQAGLDQFLFGKAAAMRQSDLWVYGGLALVLILAVFLFFKEFSLLSFNPDFAQSLGLPVKTLRFILNTLMVLAIAVGIQAVGVVLMAALLITPSAAARSWTDSLRPMMLIAAMMAALSSFAGSYLSFIAPSMPTGPWIVMSLSLMALASLFFAPKRGMLARLLQQKKHQRKIRNENILKAIYHFSERSDQRKDWLRIEDIQGIRAFKNDSLKEGLKQLNRKGLLLLKSHQLQLSKRGEQEAMRIVRLHRLWEMYLTQRLRLKSDHIHPNAETMEHIISPEIEAQLLRELDYPHLDPHQSPIPYENDN